MPNYEKLQVPQGLTYAKDIPKAKTELQNILNNAMRSHIVTAQDDFNRLINTIDGLSKCADFWVFVIRFFVISRDIPSAVENLQVAFNCQAQPNNLLFATQQSLNELQKKLESANTPKVMKTLSHIPSNFFQQSQTLMGKPASVYNFTPQEIKRYEEEKKQQNKVEASFSQLPTTLRKIE